MNKKLIMLSAIFTMSSLNASYPIIEEDKCIKIMEEEIEYDKTDSYHRECYATAIAEDVNLSGPSRIDSMTTLINITPMKGLIIYNYRVTLPKKLQSRMKEIGKALKKSTVASNCETQDIKDFILDMDIKIVHSYYSKQGDLISSFKVDSNICKNIK